MPSIDADPIQVLQPQDWQKLIDARLVTVVDPMVYRTGEIFLRGRRSPESAETAALGAPLDEQTAWTFLEENLLTLGFFFDALILNDALPIFNYSDSFDLRLNFEKRSFAALNNAAQAPVIVPVDVGYQAYVSIKEEALRELKNHMTGPDSKGGPWIPEKLAKSIEAELSNIAYRWEIDLGHELEQLLPNPLDRKMGRFLLGGMIFGQYANLMQSEHWLQPNRARLFVQLTTGAATPNTEDERQLFEWVAERYGLPALRTWQPSFFHYILERINKLSDLPGLIVKLRNSGAVRDYRGWRSQALHDWRTTGGLSKNSERTIERLKAVMTKEAPGLAAVTDAGVSLIEANAAPNPVSVAKAAAKAAPLFGWALNLLPGRRHVKLLADSAHARGRHPHIKRAVKTIWDS